MSAVEPERTGRRCVFCGAPANSKEHLLPEWLQRALPSDDVVLYFRQVGRNTADRHEWPRRPFREKAQIVCKACNHGWMNSLESRASPLLRPALARNRCAFDAVAQSVLATWALKTCLVLQASQTRDDPIAPQSHFTLLRIAGEPPPQVTVWLGQHYRAWTDPGNCVFVQRPLSLAPLDEARREEFSGFGYLCFLAVGSVAFVLVGHRDERRTDVKYDGAFNDALIKIWPVREGVTGWPPADAMDRDHIDVITVPPGGFIFRAVP